MALVYALLIILVIRLRSKTFLVSFRNVFTNVKFALLAKNLAHRMYLFGLIPESWSSDLIRVSILRARQFESLHQMPDG